MAAYMRSIWIYTISLLFVLAVVNASNPLASSKDAISGSANGKPHKNTRRSARSCDMKCEKYGCLGIYLDGKCMCACPEIISDEDDKENTNEEALVDSHKDKDKDYSDNEQDSIWSRFAKTDAMDEYEEVATPLITPSVLKEAMKEIKGIVFDDSEDVVRFRLKPGFKFPKRKRRQLEPFGNSYPPQSYILRSEIGVPTMAPSIGYPIPEMKYPIPWSRPARYTKRGQHAKN